MLPVAVASVCRKVDRQAAGDRTGRVAGTQLIVNGADSLDGQMNERTGTQKGPQSRHATLQHQTRDSKVRDHNTTILPQF